MVNATDLETTTAYEGCGQVTRQRKLTDNHSKVRVIEGTDVSTLFRTQNLIDF